LAAFESLLDEALESWTGVRQGLIEEVQNVPASKFDFRPAKGVRSFQELVAHILEVAMMMTGELTRADTNFHRAPWPKLLQLHARPVYEARTKPALVKLLRSQVKDGERKFREAGELHMLQLIVRFDGEKGSRLGWLHHGIAHEEYHRGQLTIYERLLGIEPALTRLIRGG